MAERPRHRRYGRTAGVAALAVALLAGGRLVTLPEPDAPDRPATAARAEVSVQDIWPDARIVQAPGRLADDRAYTPWYHVDAETSVGTALTGDGEHIRLIVRGPGPAVRELMRLKAGDNPQFNGFTTAGDTLLWMATGGGEGARHTLYRSDWRRGTPATAVTADTGDVIFYNSQYDLVVENNQVHWATARANEAVTEIRSVPVTGGKVAVRRVDGAYALSAWPWLTSAGAVQDGPVELRNLADSRRLTVPGSPNELVTCGPVWCRVLVLGAAGQPARTDLMRPDGADRSRVAGGGITSAALDVALVGRFEVLSLTADGDTEASSSLKVMLYDLTTKRLVVLAAGVATVQARGPVVWWSTGSDEAVVWYSLDLRTLT